MFITIYLNQQAVQVDTATSLISLHTQFKLPTQGCVFSLNGHVIPRSAWQQTMLSAGDEISLFQAIAGG